MDSERSVPTVTSRVRIARRPKITPMAIRLRESNPIPTTGLGWHHTVANSCVYVVAYFFLVVYIARPISWALWTAYQNMGVKQPQRFCQGRLPCEMT